MEHCLEAFSLSCLVLPVNVGIPLKPRFHATIVPILEETFYDPITFEVCSSAKLVELQACFHKTLQVEEFIGEDFRSAFDILLLPEMPTLDELKEKNLTDLCRMALHSDKLPTIEIADFFSTQHSGGIHFLVWLPASSDREFL
jgi:hypothetical protein